MNRNMNASICVVGTGYVGLSLVTTFDETGRDVVGNDSNEKNIRQPRTATGHPTGEHL